MGSSKEILAPSELLRQVFLRRVAKNPAYSLRAFARNLGISHAYLSMILNGRRRIPLKRAIQFSRLVGLGESDAKAFVESCREASLTAAQFAPLGTRQRTSADAQYIGIEVDKFRTVSDWYHLAILDLTLLDNFVPEEGWVARRLNLSINEVRAAVNRLTRLGLLSTTAGSWRKKFPKVRVKPSQPEQAVRRFHSQMIEKALDVVESDKAENFHRADITGCTIAANPARLKEAKKRVERFRRSLLDYLGQGECTELYQLNVQLFPLTSERSVEAGSA